MKGIIRELIFQLTHSPNSAEGLRHRANALIKAGYSKNNPMVTALIKQAEIKEGKL